MKKTRSIIGFVCIQMCCAFSFAQNLILNGSFEELKMFSGVVNYTQDQPFIIESDSGIGWSNSSKEYTPISSRYWNYTGDSLYKPLTYYSNSGLAHTGNCFGVIRMLSINPDDNHAYFDFLVAALKEPLLMGQTYKLSLYAKHLTGNTAVPNLFIQWILPNTEQPLYHHVEIVRGRIPLLENSMADTVPLPFSNDYQKFEINYTAKGGEQYIVFGNLLHQVPTKKHRVPPYGIFKKNRLPFCFLAIDDVEVYDLDDTVTSPSRIQENAITSLEPMRDNLASFYYEVDSFAATAAMIDEITSICSLLKDAKEVIVAGHTDASGTNDYNALLSEKRATAIANIIKQHCGIKSMIKSFANTQLSGNKNNDRRVEISVKY